MYFFPRNPSRKFRITQGQKPSIDEDTEASFRKFCDHAWGMGVPRTQQHLGSDIQDYSKRGNVDLPYSEKPPGTNSTNL